MIYVRPTQRQRQVLAAIVETGNPENAAAHLGIKWSSVQVHMTRMHARTGLTTVQAVYFGLRDGWLAVGEPLQGNTSTAA